MEVVGEEEAEKLVGLLKAKVSLNSQRHSALTEQISQIPVGDRFFHRSCGLCHPIDFGINEFQLMGVLSNAHAVENYMGTFGQWAESIAILLGRFRNNLRRYPEWQPCDRDLRMREYLLALRSSYPILDIMNSRADRGDKFSLFGLDDRLYGHKQYSRVPRIIVPCVSAELDRQIVETSRFVFAQSPLL